MRAISPSPPVFAPIQAANQQPYTPKPVAEKIQVQPVKAELEKTSGVWENKSFSLWDVLDVINPLQHIPVISTIYRKITGDEMGYAARIAGDTLYSGLFGSLISGLVSAVANVFVDSTTGKDIGEHMMASITPTSEKSVGAATTAPPQATIQSVTPPMTQAGVNKTDVTQPTTIQSIITQSITTQPITIQQQAATQYAGSIPSPSPAVMQQLTLPPIDPTRLQAGIDQYKWQIMADEIKTRSSRWV
ncbi:MAG: hypothetical protein Q9M16_01900 [Mariprofundus sp.]|nr:hypothetical protein [Mariprofundus sp.]